MFLLSWPGGSPGASLAIVAVVTALYALVVWLTCIAWTLRDISGRTQSTTLRMGASVLVAGTFIPGLVVYLILRPRQTLQDRFEMQLEEGALLQELGRILSCPACSRAVKEDYVACPACQTQLKTPCRTCANPLSNSWRNCPYCAERTPAFAPVPLSEPLREREQVSVPAAAITRQPLPAVDAEFASAAG